MLKNFVTTTAGYLSFVQPLSPVYSVCLNLEDHHVQRVKAMTPPITETAEQPCHERLETFDHVREGWHRLAWT